MQNIMYIRTARALLVGCVAVSVAPAISAAGPSLEMRLVTANAELKKNKKGVSEQLLMKDQGVLKAVAVSVEPTFQQRGFDKNDVDTAIVSGWIKHRIELGPGAPLTEGMVKAAVISFGRIKIDSNPSEAVVYINDVKHIENTSTVAWLKPGKHRIKVSKEGFLPSEEERVIQEGANVPVSLTLSQRPK